MGKSFPGICVYVNKDIDMKKSIFDVSVNHYWRALTRIERYAVIKNMMGDDESKLQLFKDVKVFRDRSLAFLMREGLMNDDGSFTPKFTADNPNPLIADAAYLAWSDFKETYNQ